MKRDTRRSGKEKGRKGTEDKKRDGTEDVGKNTK